MKEGNSKEMPNLTTLSKDFQEIARQQKDAITKLTMTDSELYWQYLVKPHSQIMTLNCFLHATQMMLPPLANVIFTGQLKSHFGPPPQLQPMINI